METRWVTFDRQDKECELRISLTQRRRGAKNVRLPYGPSLCALAPLRVPLPIAVLLICLCIGCEPGDKLARYKVTGKVSYQGQPVEEGQITFEDPATGQVNSSPLGSGGAYSVELPAGDYRVSVAPPLVETKSTADTPSDMIPKKVRNIPKKYWVQESSGVKAQVAKDKRTFDFELKP
jgi:hypothetical protein